MQSLRFIIIIILIALFPENLAPRQGFIQQQNTIAATSAQLNIPPRVYIKGDKHATRFITLKPGSSGKLTLSIRIISSPILPTIIPVITHTQYTLPQPVVKHSAILVNRQLIPYTKSMKVKTTAYSSEELTNTPGAGDPTITATGHKLQRGIVAVDPRFIKLGTCMYIPGYGFGKALDTGGNIKQKRIDLAVNSTTEALQWGVRTRTIYIIDCKYAKLGF